MRLGRRPKEAIRGNTRLRSNVDLTEKIGWNVAAYFTDRLAAQDVPSFTRLDTNLIWHIRENVTFGIYGQNLLKDRHQEFDDSQGGSTRATLDHRRQLFAAAQRLAAGLHGSDGGR